MVVAKTQRYRAQLRDAARPATVDITSAYSLFALLLSAEIKTEINVIDFGGAAGAHYFLARSLLPNTTKHNWWWKLPLW